MEKLSYNYEVFESGAGRIYTILSRASMPALILGVALMMTINSGMFTGFANLPDFVKILFMAVIILYIVPGIFVFPTVWMLRSWKTRSLKNCYVMAGRKSGVSQDLRPDYQQQGRKCLCSNTDQEGRGDKEKIYHIWKRIGEGYRTPERGTGDPESF